MRIINGFILFAILILIISRSVVWAGNLEWAANKYSIYNSDSYTILEGTMFNPGGEIQLIWAGDKGQIDPPNPDGSPGGDDQLIEDLSESENPSHVGYGMGPVSSGKFYVSDITYSLPAGSKVYTRIFNAQVAAFATHCGDSALYTLTSEVGETWDCTEQGIISTNQPKIPYYRDADEDNYGDSNNMIKAYSRPQGYVENPGDCDDTKAVVNPGRQEVCDGLDNNCDNLIDGEGISGCITYYRDEDNDNYGLSQDSKCLCAAKGVYTAVHAGDCDDTKAVVNPGRQEVCDGLDNNCDKLIDGEGISGCITYYRDEDNDNYGLSQDSKCLCAEEGVYTAVQTGDTDDHDPDIYPGAKEICDNKDNNDNGLTDEEGAYGCCTYFKDADTDNYGLSQDSKCLCAAEGVYTAVQPGDCNDLDSDINPKNMEIIDLNGSTIDTFAYGRNLITSLKPSCPNYTSFDLLSDFKPLNNNLSLQYWHSNSGFFYSTYWFFNQVSGERVELQDNLFFIIDRNL